MARRGPRAELINVEDLLFPDDLGVTIGELPPDTGDNGVTDPYDPTNLGLYRGLYDLPTGGMEWEDGLYPTDPVPEGLWPPLAGLPTNDDELQAREHWANNPGFNVTDETTPADVKQRLQKQLFGPEITDVFDRVAVAPEDSTNSGTYHSGETPTIKLTSSNIAPHEAIHRLSDEQGWWENDAEYASAVKQWLTDAKNKNLVAEYGGGTPGFEADHVATTVYEAVMRGDRRLDPSKLPRPIWDKVVPLFRVAGERRNATPDTGGTAIDDPGVPVMPDPYSATLPPMLEPGLLTQDNPPTRGLQLPDFGAPLRDFANAPDVNLPAGGVPGAALRGLQELARGTQPTDRGRLMQEAGAEFDIPGMRGLANIGERTIGRQDATTLQDRWYHGTPLEKALDIGGQAIPVGGMPIARSALPGGVVGGAAEVAAGFVGDVVGPSREALRGAAGVTADVARAANEALPDTLKLTGGSRAAQRGQVANPFNLRKPPAEMTAAEINKALDRLEAASSKTVQEFIDTGRGMERPSDYRLKTDPLSARANELAGQLTQLRNEIIARYGPNPPSRLPQGRGFGPREKPVKGAPEVTDAVDDASQRGQVPVNPFSEMGQGAGDALPPRVPDVGPVGEPPIPGNPPAPLKPRYRVGFDAEGNQVVTKVDAPLTPEELHRVQDAGKLPPNDGTPDGIRTALDEVEVKPTAFTEHIAQGQRPLSAEVQQSLAQQTETYMVQTNARSMAQADGLIAADREAARSMIMDMTGEPDAVRTAVAIRLMAEADRAGNVAEVETLARSVAQRLRASGQEIQMAGRWDSLSPERVMVTANVMLQDALAKHGGPAVQRQLRKAAQEAAKKQALEAAERAKMAADNEVLRATNPAKELTKRAAALEKKPVSAKTVLDDVLAIFGEKPGGRKSAGAMAYDQAEAFKSRALYIRDLPDGAEKEMLKADLLREVQENVAAEKAADTIKRMNAQDAKNRVRDLEYFMDEEVRDATRYTNADRIAVGRAKAMLKKHGVELEEDISNEWLDKAREIRGTTGQDALQKTRALLAEMKDHDPVKSALAKHTKDLEEARFLKQQAKDLLYFTNESARAAKKKADNVARQTITTAKQKLRESGVEVPEPLARAFLDGAHKLNGMPANTPMEKLLRDRAAKALLQDITAVAPPSAWGKMLEVLREAASLPRALAASFDFSWLFRQGAMGVGHPKAYAGAAKDMVKAFMHEDAADAVDAAFNFGQFGKVHNEAGLSFANRFGSPGQVEEGFVSRWLGKVPVAGKLYEGTNRAFTTAGNKFRMDAFDSTVRGWLPEHLRDQQFDSIDQLVQATGRKRADFTELGRFLSALTGRSENAFLEKASPVLSPIFWAPRYAFSRFEAPSMMLATSSNAVRGMAIKDMALFASAVALPLAVIQAAGGRVELDPRSNDFGKGEFKGVKFDFSTGIGINVRTIAQMLTGKQILSTGREADKPALEAAGDWFRNKLAPGPAVGVDVMSGSDAIGRPVNTPLEIVKDVAGRMLPMTPTEVVEAYRNVSPGMAVVAGLGSVFGVGVNAPAPGIQQAYDTAAQRVHDKTAKDLTPKEYSLLRDEPEVQAAEAELATRVGEPLEKKLRGAREDYSKAVEASEAELLAIIKSGAKGETLRKAIQEHGQRRSQSFKALFPPELREYSKRGVELSLNEQWRDAYQDVPMPLKNGEPDFREWDRLRADVLKQAEAAGANLKHVTEKGYVARNKELRPYLEAYDQAQETLRPYWEIRDKTVAASPWLQPLVNMRAQFERQGSKIGMDDIDRQIDKEVAPLKELYMMRNKAADKAYVEWGYGKSVWEKK